MDNFKKEIWSVFIITALLGVFFQINRMDAFLHLNSWQNNIQAGNIWQDMENSKAAKENYLLIYDPADVQSVLSRHIVEKIIRDQKKTVQTIPFYQQWRLTTNARG